MLSVGFKTQELPEIHPIDIVRATLDQSDGGCFDEAQQSAAGLYWESFGGLPVWENEIYHEISGYGQQGAKFTK